MNDGPGNLPLCGVEKVDSAVISLFHTFKCAFFQNSSALSSTPGTSPFHAELTIRYMPTKTVTVHYKQTFS
jgi:hypothetical protein